MALAGSFLPLILSQQMGFQVLARRPEPTQTTDTEERVTQYDRVMATKLALGYAAGLEVVYRCRSDCERFGSAIDICCGPGHYTLCLGKYLSYRSVLGIDLAPRMIQVARQNAMNQPSVGVAFEVGDATDLSHIPSSTFELSSFTDAAHHMPDLATVRRVLREMDRVTQPTGLVMVMDLVRLRTEKLTERYLTLLGGDYQDRGLADFFDDFRNSMYAVWTPDELRSAIPTDSDRWWCQVVPRGLPTIQVILGLPIGRDRPFARRGFAPDSHPLIVDWYPRWQRDVSPIWAAQTLSEWKMARLSLLTARKHFVRPGHSV